MNYSFIVSAGFGILAIILSLVGKIRN